MRTLATLLIAGILIAPSSAYASQAGSLLAACNSPAGSKERATCIAYINGYVSGVLADQVASENGKPICIDRTNTELVEGAFKQFVSQYPDAAYVDTGSVIAEALKKTFPCAKAP